MNPTTVATSALQQMDGSNLPEAFLRGELGDLETDAADQHYQLISDLPPASLDHEAAEESETMNAMSVSGGEAAQSTDVPGRDGAHAAKVANAARARAGKAEKKKATRRVMKYWTEDEEAALHTALQAVGPKWTSMVSFYGEGGTADESLKGRDCMSLSSKARWIKKRILDDGEDVPAYLEDVNATDQPKRNRSRRQASDEDSEENRDGPAPRRRGRPRRTTQMTSTVAVKEEATVIISDGEDDEDSKDWTALPSSTPKTKCKRQQPTETTDKATDHKSQMMEIRLRQARAVREEAAAKREEAAARQREASIEREMLKMNHHRKEHR